ncbi:MAG: zinc-binding dehydrogenase [Nitriliruptoraceae bacterium]
MKAAIVTACGEPDVVRVTERPQPHAGKGQVASPAPERPSDFADLLTRVAQGELSVIIDEVYALDDIVEAHRKIDSQRKVGNILVHP